MKGEAKKKGKSKENLIFAFSLILIIVVFAVPMYFGAERKFALEREIADIKAQTAEATEYGDKLKNQIKYSDEDEYVEKIARERLNMVKPDEVVYIDKNK